MGGVEATVVRINLELMFKLPNLCLVFTAKSTVILKALDLITTDIIKMTQ